MKAWQTWRLHLAAALLAVSGSSIAADRTDKRAVEVR